MKQLQQLKDMLADSEEITYLEESLNLEEKESK